MPLPVPRSKEKRPKFMERCLSDRSVQDEFRDISQRYAVCIKRWDDYRSVSADREKSRPKEGTLTSVE